MHKRWGFQKPFYFITELIGKIRGMESGFQKSDGPTFQSRKERWEEEWLELF